MVNQPIQPCQNPTITDQPPVQSPPPSQKSNKRTMKITIIFIAISTLAAFLIGGFVLGSKNKNNPPAGGPKACTQEAKLCPDGSYVSRTGPNCEFAQCPKPKTSPSPTIDVKVNWKTYSNTKYMYSFRFPITYILTDASSDKLNGKEGSVLLDLKHIGAPGFPVFYVNVVSKDGSSTNISYNADGFTNNARQYFSSKIVDIIAPPNQPWKETFTRLNDITVDQQNAEVFEGYAYGKASENGLKDRRLLIDKGEYLYLIGTYYTTTSTNEWKIYIQILQTFKFTD